MKTQLEKLSLLIADNNACLLSYWDKDMVCRYANKAYEEWFGLKPEDMIDKITMKDILPPEHYKDNTPYYKGVFEGRKQVFERTLSLENREIRNVIVTLTPDTINNETIGFYVYVDDITAVRKLQIANKEIEKSKRVAEFMGKMNDLMINAKGKEEVLSAICNIAVNSGKFLFSWIGEHDKLSNTIKPTYKAGFEDGYLSAIKSISVDDVPEGRGPSGKAFRKGKYYYCNDIANDSMMLLWKEEALKRGYLSSISLPIKVENITLYIFTIYASKPHFFNSGELKRLERISENIGFILNTFNQQKKRKKLEENQKRLLEIMENTTAYIGMTDIKRNIVWGNKAFIEGLELVGEDITKYNINDFRTKEGEIIIKEANKSLLETGKWMGENYYKSKSGKESAVLQVLLTHKNDKGEITHLSTNALDITEQKEKQKEIERLVSILENTTAYVAISDMKKNFSWGNKALKDILEINDDITKYNIADFRTKEGEQIINGANKSLVETGKWIGENFYRAKSGKVIPVLQVIILHKNEKGEPSHLSTTAIDLTDQKEKQKEIEHLNEELRAFSWDLQNVREIEKRNLSFELHDHLGQGLIALKMLASELKMLLNKDKSLLENKIDELIVQANEKVKIFRSIYDTINPAMLEELGLTASIKNEIEKLEGTHIIKIKFTTNTEEENLKLEVRLALFRIVQEALSNIVHHSKAKRCDVTLSIIKKQILLEVKDNGCGFDIQKVDVKFHHGIIAMRERAYAINAKFIIESTLKKGTLIKVEVV